MAKPSAANAAAFDRVAVLRLMQDVAESEHQLRHPAAFSAVVNALGLQLEHEAHRTTVSDPSASPAPVAAEAQASPESN
jgi:hypothetical protein